MGLESATYISGLNASNPVGATDPKSQGDDHLRLLKSTILNTFPGITGAVSASHVELSLLDGVLGVTGSGNMVLSASPTLTGTIIAAALTASGLITAATFSGNGAALTALNATQLTSGTVPDARFPSTLPALNGSALTALNASNLASGTVPDARFPSVLPAISGAALTGITESQIADGSLLARVAGTETISGAWTYSTRPKSSSAGGFLSHASSSNTGGSIIITNTVPTDTTGMNAGDIKLVYS